MLKPKVPVEEFEKFGFKKCKGIPSDQKCYYLCVSRGCKFLFVSPVCFSIQDWDDKDTRIHARPNCRYSDQRDALDIILDLIHADMLER